MNFPLTMHVVAHYFVGYVIRFVTSRRLNFGLLLLLVVIVVVVEVVVVILLL